MTGLPDIDAVELCPEDVAWIDDVRTHLADVGMGPDAIRVRDGRVEFLWNLGEDDDRS